MNRIEKSLLAVVSAAALALVGCSSAHVGMGIPVPGPVKPSVGVTVDRSGLKGTGGVSSRIGKVPVYAGGTTKPIIKREPEVKSKAKVKGKDEKAKGKQVKGKQVKGKQVKGKGEKSKGKQVKAKGKEKDEKGAPQAQGK